MALYEVQDDDEPMYVRASSMDDAVARWRRWRADVHENEMRIHDNPLGVRYVADDSTLVFDDPHLEEAIVKRMRSDREFERLRRWITHMQSVMEAGYGGRLDANELRLAIQSALGGATCPR